MLQNSIFHETDRIFSLGERSVIVFAGSYTLSLSIIVKMSRIAFSEGLESRVSFMREAAGYAHINHKKVKVKVRLSLCLTKHCTMKMYWGSGGIVPHILHLDTRWR